MKTKIISEYSEYRLNEKIKELENEGYEFLPPLLIFAKNGNEYKLFATMIQKNSKTVKKSSS